jgi:glycosyltransferase involved in cell wall biosynthesis
MRIIFAQDPPDLYGASRSLLRLTSRLVKEGHQVLVVISHDGPLCSLLRESNIQVEICPRLTSITRRRCRSLRGLLTLFSSFLRSIPEFWRVVSRFHPDIIHTNNSLILTSGVVATLRRIPHLWHVREIFADFPRLWSSYQRYLCLFSNRVVCVSRAVASQFTCSAARRKVRVLHNGFPADEFSDVSSEHGKEFRQRHGLDGNLLVGSISRIKLGRKGQDVLLRAAALLKPRFPDVRFVLVGGVFPGNEAHLEQLQRLRQELDLSDRVICTGDIQDVKAAYAALDISVQASVMPEAFSGVVIESMAMGIPIVATRCGGTTEQIEDGVTGFLVQPGDAEQMASALERLFGDPDLRSRLASRAKKDFLERFEFESFYRNLRAIQCSVTNTRNIPAPHAGFTQNVLERPPAPPAH